MLVAFIGEPLVLQSRRRSNEGPTAQQGQDQGNDVLDSRLHLRVFLLLP